jgi:hypothetical protein
MNAQDVEALRQLDRERIERELEASDPIAAYDSAEKKAWEGVPECQTQE